VGGGDEACGVGWGVRREARGARREAWSWNLDVVKVKSGVELAVWTLCFRR
jgi:hypothetical protein